MTNIVGLLGPNQDPTIELCANTPYAAAVPPSESGECLTIEWIVTETPAGVDPEDVYISNKWGVETFIEVPTEGRYAFAVNCCRPA